MPPSPPDTPTLKVNGTSGVDAEKATAATREELARKLRRVASAPNAQGLFSKSRSKGSGERPATAELSKEPLIENQASHMLGLVESKTDLSTASTMVAQDKDVLGALPEGSRTPLAFRRTYSSNSIKVRNVEVGPQSFDKIKLIGKGDVGKVYLVREKKSNRLYAMKGMCHPVLPQPKVALLTRPPLSYSSQQEGDDQAE
jgi:protein-serine/threonine kinase